MPGKLSVFNHVYLQELPLVPTVTSNAPMQASGQSSFLPPVSMMESAVNIAYEYCKLTTFFLPEGVIYPELNPMSHFFFIDCCDTTDEYNSGAICQNTCK